MSDQNEPRSAEARSRGDDGPDSALYKRDFWSKENLNYSRPHYRMEKAARILNRLANGKRCTLLDVGCGPATLRHLLEPNVEYFGIDIAIQEAAPDLIEADFVEGPIRFGDKTFDLVIAQGVFEYVGTLQAQKFAEIAELLSDGGILLASYVNFAHRKTDMYWPYSNIQPLARFRSDLADHFDIKKSFPTSHNWRHAEPGRPLIKAANMHINVNIPLVSTALGVEYFFICSRREPTAAARTMQGGATSQHR